MAHPRLPIEPFRTWLERQLHDCDDMLSVLSTRIGVDESRIRAWLRDTQQIRLADAERAVCAAGDHITEVYADCPACDGDGRVSGKACRACDGCGLGSSPSPIYAVAA